VIEAAQDTQLVPRRSDNNNSNTATLRYGRVTRPCWVDMTMWTDLISVYSSPPEMPRINTGLDGVDLSIVYVTCRSLLTHAAYIGPTSFTKRSITNKRGARVSSRR